MKKNFVWPVDKLKDWIATGKTHKWIGNELGVSPKHISSVCKRFGIACQRSGPRSGSEHPNWTGGRVIDKNGYILVFSPNHPMRRGKYVLEHRLVMEQSLGRLLERQEVVHHKDGNKQNNSIENLELFDKNSSHLKHELTGRVPKWTNDGRLKIYAAQKKWSASRSGQTIRVLKKEDVEFYYLKCGWIPLAIVCHLKTSLRVLDYWLKKYQIQNKMAYRAHLRMTPLGAFELQYSPLGLKAYASKCKEFHSHLKKLLDTNHQRLSERAWTLWLEQVYPHSMQIQKMADKFRRCVTCGHVQGRKS